VDHVVLVQVFQADEDVGSDEFGLLLGESAPPADVVTQVAAGH
jgi:hypothetical protein